MLTESTVKEHVPSSLVLEQENRNGKHKIRSNIFMKRSALLHSKFQTT
jgi:hypothetical protein